MSVLYNTFIKYNYIIRTYQNYLLLRKKLKKEEKCLKQFFKNFKTVKGAKRVEGHCNVKLNFKKVGICY